LPTLTRYRTARGIARARQVSLYFLRPAWYSNGCDELISWHHHFPGLELLVVETEHAAPFLFRRMHGSR